MTTVEQTYRLRPRNEYVLIRGEKIEQLRGVALPDGSSESTRFVVVAFGPKVEGLKEGDEVRLVQSPRDPAISLRPQFPDLFVVKQESVILVLERLPEETAYEQVIDEA